MEISDKVKQLARDLTHEEPRSPYLELGGEQFAARALDKCRATLAGCAGEYQFGCPMDQHFFAETGIDANAFKEYVATGASDEEVADWVSKHSRARR
jgi:hypothetical protein